jgi:hypothetical protein
MTLFEKYSYKQKKLALLIITVLLGAVAYKRAFKVTLDLKDLKQELTVRSQEAATSTERLAKKQIDLKNINTVIGKENTPNDVVQQQFLLFIENTDSKLIVESIEEVYRYDHPDFIINTNVITIKGGYIPLVKFIYALEKKFNYARLVSSHIYIKKNKKLKIDELYATLTLQNFSDR